MRTTTIIVVFGTLFLAHCDLLKREQEQKAAAGSDGGVTTTSGGVGNSAQTTTTAATAEPTSDPSKGATSGCAWPQDGKKDVTITKGCAVVAKSSIYVDEGATLTIEEGATISFDTDVFLWIEYGKLVVKGTDAAPVKFTSSNKSPGAGDWVGLGFRGKTSAGTSLDHLIIEYAGSKSSSGVGSIHIENMKQGGRISITNSTFRQSAQFGIVADDNATFAKFENNTFKDNKSGSLKVFAEVLGSVGRGNTFSQPIHVQDSNVDQTTTWPAFDVPVLVDGNVNIRSDSSLPILTIADKTVVKMGQDRYFSVGDGAQPGALVAKNVTFTSNSPSPSEGDWVGFFIHSKSGGTDIENCSFEYFGSNTSGGAGALTLWSVNAKDVKGLTIANNTFRKGKQQAMKSDDGDCAGFVKNNKVEGIPFCNKR